MPLYSFCPTQTHEYWHTHSLTHGTTIKCSCDTNGVVSSEVYVQFYCPVFEEIYGHHHIGIITISLSLSLSHTRTHAHTHTLSHTHLCQEALRLHRLSWYVPRVHLVSYSQGSDGTHTHLPHILILRIQNVHSFNPLLSAIYKTWVLLLCIQYLSYSLCFEGFSFA